MKEKKCKHGHRKCCITGCDTLPGITLHKFPTYNPEREQWEKFVGDDFEPSDDTFLCQKLKFSNLTVKEIYRQS